MNKVILYVIIGLLIVGLLVMTFFPNVIYLLRDSGNNPDKCSPPAGTSEEAWQEHMSHHPSMYEECLT